MQIFHKCNTGLGIGVLAVGIFDRSPANGVGYMFLIVLRKFSGAYQSDVSDAYS